jgi:two-component system, OmpR family, response regulator
MQGVAASRRVHGAEQMRILVIEDDASVLDYISRGLRESGFAVDQSADGKDGLYRASAEKYDALVVDRMLPGIDGLTIIRTLRGADNNTPALILSALGEVDDRVKGLKAGGDDYLVKPFAFAELLARIEALLRRKESSSAVTRLRVADLEMDLLSHKVTRAGKSLNLQPREFRLLEYLMKHAGQVVTRTMLLENVWDYHFDPQTNVIDVHISRLRQKLDKEFDKPLLKTVRGAGYMLDEPEQDFSG